jgi:hypothetical protein
VEVYRAWINQPSKFDHLHVMHGTKCIVIDEGEKSVRIYFTSGPIHSMQVMRQCVSRLYISAAETKSYDITKE